MTFSGVYSLLKIVGGFNRNITLITLEQDASSEIF